MVPDRLGFEAVILSKDLLNTRTLNASAKYVQMYEFSFLNSRLFSKKFNNRNKIHDARSINLESIDNLSYNRDGIGISYNKWVLFQSCFHHSINISN